MFSMTIAVWPSVNGCAAIGARQAHLWDCKRLLEYGGGGSVCCTDLLPAGGAVLSVANERDSERATGPTCLRDAMVGDGERGGNGRRKTLAMRAKAPTPVR